MNTYFCISCPIRNTQYCHAINPKAPKYTRAEKMAIRDQLDKEVK